MAGETAAEPDPPQRIVAHDKRPKPPFRSQNSQKRPGNIIVPRELFGLKRRSVVRKISRILRLLLSPASHDDVLQG